MKYYMGVDPGQGGGVAILDDSGGIHSTVAMPATPIEILHALGKHGRDIQAALEGVHASPQMGVVSSFSFGKGYGGLEMALFANGVPFITVYPKKWQNALDCLTGGDKNVSKAKALSLWPGYKITHAIADALLLAEYVRRLHESAF